MALTSTLPVTQARPSTAAKGGSAHTGTRLAAMLLVIAAQGVALTVVVLLVLLLGSEAPLTTLTPTPTPQSAPVAQQVAPAPVHDSRR